MCVGIVSPLRSALTTSNFASVLYSGFFKCILSLSKLGIPNVPSNSVTGVCAVAVIITERSSAILSTTVLVLSAVTLTNDKKPSA